MPVDPVALKAELETDPKVMGFAFPDDPVGDAEKLNERGLSGETIEVEFVTTLQAHAAVDLPEFLTLSSGEQNFWLAMIQAAAVEGGFPVKDPAVRAQIGGLFRAGPQPVTRAALIALQSRPASRAEVLFGEDVAVSAPQITDTRSI